MNWQLIETAPKDGSRILVWWKYPYGNPTTVILRWACVAHSLLSRRHNCPDEPDCCMEWLGTLATRYIGTPTHWMHLPAPPAPAE